VTQVEIGREDLAAVERQEQLVAARLAGCGPVADVLLAVPS